MSFIQLEIKEGSAIVRLNRPEKFNSFNRTMAVELQSVLDQCAGDDSVRAVLITGNGKAFSAGQDLQEVTSPDAPGFQSILRDGYNPIISKIRTMSKPVIAAVNGVAAGAGANIALCCDIVVASESASFIQAFSKIGLIPDSGGTFFLPRLVGFQKASALMMLGEKITGQEAERLGMIYACYPAELFEEKSDKLLETLATMPTQGLALTKKALNQSLFNSLDEQLLLEEDLQIEAGNTSDYREGVASFIEKRPPVFRGK
jgi:2-(1,2-epoxy-1,2-dihydrophenyl)acetyl-CoA isomerase